MFVPARANVFPPSNATPQTHLPLLNFQPVNGQFLTGFSNSYANLN
jgi:hypothetical protein